MNYSPITSADRREMLSFLGVDSIEKLFTDVPAEARLKKPLDLPAPQDEAAMLSELYKLSKKNASAADYVTFLGAGNYNHFIPSVVKHITSRSEFYTAYTPYQPEASQGTLQAIYEYQTMICNLTEMDIANASMYDGATAVAEAALLACSFTKRKEIFVSKTVHPNYRKVLKTYATGADLKVTELLFGSAELNDQAACVIVQQPNFFGCIENIESLEAAVHKNGSLLVVSVDPISLGILKPPGEYGADIVVGEGQSLGNPQNFGGPGLGIFAVKQKFMRNIPGRLVGMTNDSEGKRAFCLTLQAREQHIRREKAGSNICSNEALCALAAAVYLSSLGPKGIKNVAEECLRKAHYLADKLKDRLLFPTAVFFKEFAIKLDKPVSEVNKMLFENGIIGGLDLGKFYPEYRNCMLVAVTELIKQDDLDRFASFIG